MGLSWQVSARTGMVPHPSCAYEASAIECGSVWERTEEQRFYER
jgi:hypothetical protein